MWATTSQDQKAIPFGSHRPIRLIDSVIKLKINTNVGINFTKCTQFAFTICHLEKRNIYIWKWLPLG